MTTKETHADKTILRVLLAAAAVLLLAAGVFCGAAAAADDTKAKITYHADLGSLVQTDTQEFTPGTWITLKPESTMGFTEPAGNKFIGWAIGSPDATSYLSDQHAVQRDDGVDLYAKWAEVTPVTGTIKISQNGYYQLSKDTVEGTISVDTNILAVIDLNGKTLNAKGAGPAITNDWGILTLVDTGGNGKITGGKAKDGGGVYMKGGMFMMTGGSIEGNKAEYGGGVYVTGGTSIYGSRFEMKGGSISGNTAVKGGGVLVAEDCTFTIAGGSIKGNKAENGGGVSVNGTFNMYGGSIENNVVENDAKTGHGGGVYVEGGFTIADGSIVGNEADCDGGGVYVNKGVFTMNGGSIEGRGTGTGDSVADFGGGVYVAGGRFNMEGGSISICMADDNGGGVYVNNKGAFTMSGTASITNNFASGLSSDNGHGGGVYLNDGTFEMHGGKINGNCGRGNGGGVYVVEKWYCWFTMTSGSIEDNEAKHCGGGVYIAGRESAMHGGTITRCTAGDYGGGVFVGNDGAFTIAGGSLTENKADYGGGVYIAENGTFTMNGSTITQCTADDDGGGVYLAGSWSRMNGGTITQCTADDDGGGVYVKQGTFAMNDGTITRCTADDYGGGVFVYDDGTFTMDKGTITQCTADDYGGGVYVAGGRFNMDKGTITQCTAADDGGGVFVYEDGTFAMSHGTITQCTADDDGGGVFVYDDGTFTMDKGTITQCTAADDGGGVYVDTDGRFVLSGTPLIKYNTSGGSANNVVLDETDNLTLAGPLTGGEIRITKVDGGKPRSGAVFGTAAAGASANRIVADSGGLIGTNDNGSLKWISGVLPVSVVDVTINGGVLIACSDITTAWNTAKKYPSDTVTVKLNADVETASTLTVPNNYNSGSLTLDLNGKVLKMTGQDSAVKVFDGGNLILKDSSIHDKKYYFNYNSSQNKYIMDTDASSGELEVSGGCLTGGQANYGGGVFVDAGGVFTLDGGNVVGNSAIHGGGVYVHQGGSFRMTNTGSVAGNTVNVSDGQGGGVYAFKGTKETLVEFTGGSITQNRAVSGGGIYTTGTLTMSHGSISNNTARDGGGVYIAENGTFTVIGGSSITRNTADLNGGGVYNAGTFTMRYIFLSGNTASLNGGGVYNTGTFTMYDGVIENNTASGTDEVESGSGGGVFVDAGGSFTMSGGIIYRNKVLKNSSSGGGVMVYNGGRFTMSGTAQITRNNSAGYGGGVMVYNGGKFEMNGGVIGSDTALTGANTAAYGAGVFVENGDFTMTGGTIGYNHSSVYFGGVSFYNDTTADHTFTMSGGVIKKNSSDLEETAVIKEQGVAIGCSEEARPHTFFKMSGSALIDESNSLYLANGMFITVPAAFASYDAGAKSILFDEDGTLEPVGIASVYSEEIAQDPRPYFYLHRHYIADPAHPWTLKKDSTDPKKIVAAIHTVTVTFESNGGSEVPSQTVVRKEVITRPDDPVRENYRFAGWYTDDGVFNNKYNFDEMVLDDFTLYAKWNELYKITYDGNEAAGTPPVDTTWYASGAEAIVSGKGDLTKGGHTFSGWNTAADGTGTGYQPGAAITMTADITLYAQWKQNTYTVTYNANGASGSAPTDSNTYAAGQNVTVLSPPAEMIYTGFEFVCWNTQADGNGTDYAAGSSLTMPERDLPLYAKWSGIPQYTLAYNANGATSGTAPETQSCYVGESLTVSGNTGYLEKTGNIFSGWNTKQDGTGEKTYLQNDPITMNANITLYAKWVQITYTITYHSNFDSETKTRGRHYDDGTGLLPGDTFTRTGYTFAGWNTKSDGAGTAYQPGYTGNLTSTAEATVALYAQWIPIKYTITYHSNFVLDNTESQDRYYDDGKKLFPADTFSRTGYTFSCWNTQADGLGTTYQPEYTDNLASTAGAAVALYALWTENEHTYTIHFDANGGTGTMEDTTNCYYNTDIPLPPNSFTRTGYTFSGWIDPASPFKPIPDEGTVNFREDQVTGGEVTLKALWTPAICTVNFYKEKDDTTPYLIRPVSYDSLIDKPDDPEKPGYTFDWWYKEDDTAWDFDTPLTKDNLDTDNTLKLYAKWTENPRYHIIIYQSAGGTVISNYLSAAHGTVIYLTVIPDSGYRLVELKSDQVEIGPGVLTFTMPEKDVNIYPVFELIPSPVPSHSSEPQGSSTWLTATPTPTPTPAPTAEPTLEIPTVKPLPSQTGASPVPLAGILAGLGCAAVLFGLRRK